MKKSKPILPISMSAQNKRQQQLFTPYKIDWKPSSNTTANNPLAETHLQNNNGRSFFKNIKNQLTHIKSDVQKLIHNNNNARDSRKSSYNNPSNSRKEGSPLSSCNKNDGVRNRDKKCSSFSHTGHLDMFQFRKTAAEQENERKLSQKCDNSSSCTQNSEKLVQLQQKVESLQFCNRQILDKLKFIEGRFDNNHIVNMVERQNCREQLHLEIQTKEHEKKSRLILDVISSKIQETESDIGQKIAASSSSVFSNSKTQKLEQKIELLQKQMERLQNIIIQLQNSNKATHNAYEGAANQLQTALFSNDRLKQQVWDQKQFYQQRIQSLQRNQIQQLQNSAEIKKMQLYIDELNQYNEALQIELQQLKASNDCSGTNDSLAKERQKSTILQLKLERKHQQLMSFVQKAEQNNYNQQRQITQFKQTIQSLQKELQRKEQVLTKESLKNKQLIQQNQSFQQQNYSFKIELTQKSNAYEMINSQHQNYIVKLESQLQLAQKARCLLQNTCNQQSEEISTLRCKLQTQTFDSSANQINKMQSLGRQFEDKINGAYEQIYSLKKKLNHAENQVQQMKTRKTYLEDGIRLYEERDRESETIKNTRGYKAQEYDRMAQQIRTLTQQNEEITDKYQMLVMKLENQIDAMKAQIQERKSQGQFRQEQQRNINLSLKNQIQENQQLRGALKQKQDSINQLRSEMRQEKERNQILNQKLSIANLQKMSMDQVQQQVIQKDGLRIHESRKSNESGCSSSNAAIQGELQMVKKKQESTEKILQVRNKELKMKDQFITRALIGKINKRQDQQEVTYMLRQLQEIMSRHMK